MSLTALIVDDDTGFRRAFQAFFSDWTVDTAEDGDAAKRILERKTFDVVVLDRNMPKMKGNEVLLWMSTRAEHQYACTIMCTAFGEIGEAVEAMKLGAWYYVLKPVTDLNLLKALLLPGIALKRCNKARSELLAAPDWPTLFGKLSAVCEYATGGEGGLHLLLGSPGGETVRRDGSFDLQRRHAFANKAMQGEESWVNRRCLTQRHWLP